MNNLPVFIDNIRVQNNVYIPLAHTQSLPKIDLKAPKNKYYAMMMIDPDAPAPANSSPGGSFLHWLAINNNVIVPFTPPAPPKGSGVHRYYIYVFEQPAPINLSGPIPRQNFLAKKFVDFYKLKLVNSIMFKTSSN